jgi:hypothetical protein
MPKTGFRIRSPFAKASEDKRRVAGKVRREKSEVSSFRLHDCKTALLKDQKCECESEF